MVCQCEPADFVKNPLIVSLNIYLSLSLLRVLTFQTGSRVQLHLCHPPLWNSCHLLLGVTGFVSILLLREPRLRGVKEFPEDRDVMREPGSEALGLMTEHLFPVRRVPHCPPLSTTAQALRSPGGSLARGHHIVF